MTTDPTPFTALDDAFKALCHEPRPLCFHGRLVPGLPAREMPFTELRDRLLHPSTTYEVRDAAMAILVGRAKSDGGAATIALCGVLLPGLRRAASPFVRACPDRSADVEADMLAGLLSALASVSPRRHRLAGHLVGMAVSSARRAVRDELAERGRVTHEPSPSEPHRPFGHPDFVLAAAVIDGVVSAEDAELIGATRLGREPLKRAARARGISYVAARHRRARAEQRLVEYLGRAPGRVEPVPSDGTTTARLGTQTVGTNGLAICIPKVRNVRGEEGGTTGGPSRVGALSASDAPRR